MTRDEFVRVLGPPDEDVVLEFSSNSELQYGYFEFFYREADGVVFAIQNDNFSPEDPDRFQASRAFDFDPWIFRAGRRHSMAEALKALDEQGVKYEVVSYFGRNAIESPAGVVLDFASDGDDEDDPPDLSPTESFFIGFRLFQSTL